MRVAPACLSVFEAVRFHISTCWSVGLGTGLVAPAQGPAEGERCQTGGNTKTEHQTVWIISEEVEGSSLGSVSLSILKQDVCSVARMR